MQLYQNVSLNEAIPNTMSREGLEFLGELAKRLPKAAVMAEAGALYGATAWTFSKNGPADAKIYSIDPWLHERWMDQLAEHYKGCAPLSVEAFESYTTECGNVIPVQGYAPGALAHVEKLDLFFEDATHTNPVFAQNMNHFSATLNPGGILCGDDFGPAWPVVVAGVIKQANAWNTPVLVRGRVWAMVKPQDSEKSRDIVDLMTSHGRWGVMLETAKGGKFVSSQDAFGGTFGFGGRLAGLCFFSEGLPLEWHASIIDASGKREVVNSNEWYRKKSPKILGLSISCNLNGAPVKGSFQCVFVRSSDRSLVYSRRNALGTTIKREAEDDLALCDIRISLDLPS